MLKVSQLIKNLRQLDPDAVIVDMDLTIEIDPEIGFVQRWYLDVEEDDEDGDDDPEKASAEPEELPQTLKLKIV